MVAGSVSGALGTVIKLLCVLLMIAKRQAESSDKGMQDFIREPGSQGFWEFSCCVSKP